MGLETEKFKRTISAVIGIVLIVVGSVIVYGSNHEKNIDVNNSGRVENEEVQPEYFINDEISFGHGVCNDVAFRWESSTDHLLFQEDKVNGKGLKLEKLSDDVLSLTLLKEDITSIVLSENTFNSNPTLKDKFETFISGVYGNCLVETAFTVAQDSGVIGKDKPSIAPFYHLAKSLYSHGLKSETSTWNFNKLERLILGANTVVKEEQRKLQFSCSTSEWYKLGDGRCDQELNNAECNFDNGDCCPQTCKNYAAAWDGLSPEDNEGNFHEVYDCSSATESTCVPTCNGDRTKLGDGICDNSLNNEVCGYDLGDCCEKTCEGSGCGSKGFNCLTGANGLCFRAGYCNNDDFGMCGLGGACVLSLCGDCRCHYECQDHDQYCSCDGMLSLGCVNVFRSWCD